MFKIVERFIDYLKTRELIKRFKKVKPKPSEDLVSNYIANKKTRCKGTYKIFKIFRRGRY